MRCLARIAATPLEAVALAANTPVVPDGLEPALTRWVAAFNDLNWPAFQQAFASDATVFHPSPVDDSGRRVDPADFDRTWLATFGSLKARSGRTSPPYLSITPRDLRIDPLSADAAVVTFHLSADPWPGRRTVVWRRNAEGWRIVHLHASRLPPSVRAP